jgi:lysine-N-methylase
MEQGNGASDGEAIAFRYMTRFRCVGPACADSCCTGSWRITVDERHYKKLKAAMDGSADERERFRAGHQRLRGEEKSPHRYAMLTVREDGGCVFLDPGGLCRVHRDYGEAFLSNTCATYPRSLARVGERIELTGTLSCPEVAKLVLLEDDAMELESISRSEALPRPLAGVRIDPDAAPYARYFDDVRAAVLALLGRTEYPVSSRLFFVTYLAAESAPFFHDRATQVDESRLAGVFEALERPEVLARLHEGFAALQPPGALALALIDNLLGSRLRTGTTPGFRALVDGAAAVYGSADAAGDPDAILARYAERRAPWERDFAASLERYFAHYAMNFWMRESYLDSPNLLVHAQELAVRIGVVRFLLFAHPDLGAAPAADASAAERSATLDRAAVEVFYGFSRNIEHGAGFLRRIREALARAELQTFAHTAMLLKF